MAAPDVSNMQEMVTALTERSLESLRRRSEASEISRIQASRVAAKQMLGAALREAGVRRRRAGPEICGEASGLAAGVPVRRRRTRANHGF